MSRSKSEVCFETDIDWKELSCNDLIFSSNWMTVIRYHMEYFVLNALQICATIPDDNEGDIKYPDEFALWSHYRANRGALEFEETVHKSFPWIVFCNLNGEKSEVKFASTFIRPQKFSKDIMRALKSHTTGFIRKISETLETPNMSLLWNSSPSFPITAEEDSDDEYEVECILDIRKGKSKRREYRIKWVGYDDSHISWEPETMLVGCLDILQEFIESNPKAKTFIKGFDLIKSLKMSNRQD